MEKDETTTGIDLPKVVVLPKPKEVLLQMPKSGDIVLLEIVHLRPQNSYPSS
jgi:hypothetical protein